MSASSAGLVGHDSVDNYILLAMDSGCVFQIKLFLGRIEKLWDTRNGLTKYWNRIKYTAFYLMCQGFLFF